MKELSSKISINAPLDRVWKIVSSIDDDPQYWDGISRVRNISVDRNVVVRDVFLGGENICRQTVIFFPNDGIHVKWTKGPIRGTRDIILTGLGSTTTVEIQMRYRLAGIVSLFSKNAAKYLQEEARTALQLIKEKAEGTLQKPVFEERRQWADLIRQRN
ncbi:MAG TPA: SRPBCC family protein [Candidatus Nitrosotalea sp.]|nr:SRPBCC family protein [Candidatus Nitrosotalea sp.]